MFAKLLGFLSCLFISCATDTNTGVKIVEAPHEPVVQVVAPQPVIEPIETVKITPLPADYQVPQQEPVKSYKDVVDATKVCGSYDLRQTTSGTGVEAMKIYNKINDCERKVVNTMSMPKDIACEQIDGFHNIMLQFDWNFSGERSFSTASSDGFYKMGDKLYYQITQGFFESDFWKKFFYEYDCKTEKSIEIKRVGGYISDYNHYKDTLMFAMTLGGRFVDGIEIGIYKNEQISFLDITSFSGFNSIDKTIQEYAKNHKISGLPDKNDNIEYFRRFDIQNIDAKHGKAKLVITMPGFQLTYTIDIFEKIIN